MDLVDDAESDADTSEDQAEAEMQQEALQPNTVQPEIQEPRYPRRTHVPPDRYRIGNVNIQAVQRQPYISPWRQQYVPVWYNCRFPYGYYPQSIPVVYGQQPQSRCGQV